MKHTKEVIIITRKDQRLHDLRKTFAVKPNKDSMFEQPQVLQ